MTTLLGSYKIRFIGETALRFLKKVEVVPAKNEVTITFSNGEISHDVQCGHFFQMMDSKGAGPKDARAYADMAKTHGFSPGVDWNEIERILSTFEAAEGKRAVGG